MVLPATPETLPKSISNFIARSKELEKADALMSYFCKLYSVEQILNKGLHTSDDAVSGFAIALLDDIENFKKDSDQSVLDVLNDKETSLAYILNFGDKIFNNSLTQIQNHRSNKGTAIGFLASVNFYELLKLWKDEDKQSIDSSEVLKKTRYAKFHAARIIKALKNGEDPNEYDPPELDPPLGEEEEEEEAVGTVGDAKGIESGEQDEDLNVKSETIIEPEDNNLGLPQVPQFIDEEPKQTSPQSPPTHTTKPSTQASTSPELSLPEPPKNIPTPPTKPKSESAKSNKPIKETTQSDITQIIESGEIYNKAQKHAKFAISAMNYEDKETALKQLEDAIALLKQLH